MKTYDVIIIGGGIVGTACAEACVREGLQTALIERHIIGGGATAAGMGHIVVLDDSPAQFALTQYAQTLWNQRSDEWPSEGEILPCGTLWLAVDDEEMAEVHRKYTAYAKRGLTVEILSAEAVRAAEPQVRPDVVGALWVGQDSVVYPPCIAQYLAQKAERSGLALYAGQAVQRIENEVVHLQDGARFSAPIIVNATGHWAEALTPEVGVRPRKGHLAITARYPGLVRHQLVELGYLKSAHSMTTTSVAFNVQPRQTGQILIGSSRQFDVSDPAVEPSIMAAMMNRTFAYVPVLKDCLMVRTWTGFRAATADKLPLIGPTEHPNIWLATGHEGLGITTSLATAELLVHQILGTSPSIDPTPYLPTRTAIAAVYV